MADGRFQLFAANCTKQDFVFRYRMPGQAQGVKQCDIPIGRQVQVGEGNFDRETVDGIAAQLRRGFNAVPVNEIARVRDFVGVSYSINNAIPADVIEGAVEHNDEVLTERGREMQTEAAVATHATLNQPEITGREDVLKATHVEVEEVPQRGGRAVVGTKEATTVERTAGRGRKGK